MGSLVEKQDRKSGRDAVTAACRVRGIAFRAVLSDLSLTGCCADVAPHVARPGEQILLQLGRLLVLPATVRWVEDGRAGLEFASPLHGAMLSEYASRQRKGRGKLH